MVAICKLGIFTAKFFPLCALSEILHNEEVEYTFLTKFQQMTWGKEVKSRTRVSDSEVWVRPKNLLFSQVPRCGWYYAPRHLNSRCFLWTWSWFPWPPLPSISRTTWAALTKCCRLHGLNDRHFPPTAPHIVLEAGCLRLGCQHGWVVVRALFLACRQPPSCHVLTWQGKKGAWVSLLKRTSSGKPYFHGFF